MALTERGPLGRQRTKVLDVVRDHGPQIGACDLKKHPIAAPHEIAAVGGCDDVEPALAQQDGDLG